MTLNFDEQGPLVRSLITSLLLIIASSFSAVINWASLVGGCSVGGKARTNTRPASRASSRIHLGRRLLLTSIIIYKTIAGIPELETNRNVHPKYFYRPDRQISLQIIE